MMLRKKTTIKKAFTLIELLMAIAIIGILASIIIVMMSDVRTKAQDKSAVTTLSSASKIANMCTVFGAQLIKPKDQNKGGGLICSGQTEEWPALPKNWRYNCGTSGCDGTINYNGAGIKTVSQNGVPTAYHISIVNGPNTGNFKDSRGDEGNEDSGWYSFKIYSCHEGAIDAYGELNLESFLSVDGVVECDRYGF